MSKDKVRILVVDDEPQYVWTIQVSMEAKGYEVLVAEDGQTAIECIINEYPDIVILDVKMPGLDGYEVCRRVREFSTVPIIMLTGLAGSANRIRGLDVGADHYMTKPFSLAELLARMQAVLRRVEISKMRRPPFHFSGRFRLPLILPCPSRRIPTTIHNFSRSASGRPFRIVC